MKNDTIAKLLKCNNQLSVKTSTVNNSSSLGTMTRNVLTLSMRKSSYYVTKENSLANMKGIYKRTFNL